MKNIVLYRYQSNDQGTLGLVQLDDIVLHSLELPWRDNQSNISCIPSGEYQVTRRYSPSFKKELYWVRNVKDRSYILIHGANFAGDKSKGWQTHLQGCISLGMVTAQAKNKYGKVQQCIGRSREAINRFEEYLDNKDFILTIKDYT